MLTAPGPGRSAPVPPSTRALPEAGMQKTAAMVTGCARLSVRFPAVAPDSSMRLQVARPKQPWVRWQVEPSGGLVSGGTGTGGMQVPAPPTGQKKNWFDRLGFDTAVSVVVPVPSGARSTPRGPRNSMSRGRQSAVVFFKPTGLQGWPWFLPLMQWFVPVPTESQSGHDGSVAHTPVPPARSAQSPSATQRPNGIPAPTPAFPSAPLRQNFSELLTR